MDSLTSQAGSRLSSSRRRGFNLIEAAIVLGVIGLIIGGIWIAAVTVRENTQANQTHAAVLKLVNVIRQTYAGFTPNQISTRGLGSNDFKIMHTLNLVGAFDPEVFPRCTTHAVTNSQNYCQTMFDPWPIGLYVAATRWSSPTGRYIIQINTISKKACIKLITSFKTVDFANGRILEIGTGAMPNIYNNAASIDLDQVINGCGTYPTFFMVFEP